MSSERLYYTDAYLVEFDAVVREVRRDGDRWRVTLDRTAFYPSSGGQPFDRGTLGDAQVVDVRDETDGSVAHVVDGELEKDARVRGRIDWTRRFDHMQQHTGQHLLSATFEREVGAKTTSFHLGATSSTIDLDKELSPEQIARVEETANRVLWENREIGVKFVSEAEAAALPLRKDPARTGDLRIVEIRDYDLSACGGTHVRRTGAIGMITVGGVERFKGGLRVEFLCGGRALQAHRTLRHAVQASVKLLSVLPDELPSAIERLQGAGRGLQKVQDALVERLAGYEAAALAEAGEPSGGTTIVAKVVSGWDANGLKKLASAVVARPATAAVLITSESPALIVVGRSQDVAFDSGAVLKKLLDQFGGKGGGKGAFAQAGGLSGSPSDVLAAARREIDAALGSR